MNDSRFSPYRLWNLRRWHAGASLAVFFSLHAAPGLNAVLFFGTADSSFNTTAPTGPLLDSGWQFQGQWGGFLGTPIASQYFITAGHVGGSVGQTITLNSVTYTTTDMFDDPNSDLRIWKISGAFPAWAPLYTASDEVGKSLVVLGRGTQRGADVTVSSQLKGWEWGTADGLQRWGENAVAGVVDGGPGLGNLLAAAFDAGAGVNEAHLSVGDSGGGVFIKDGSVWKLAGINFAVDGPYNTVPLDSGQFQAAIFDEGGLYKKNGLGVWVLTPDQAGDIPGNFYSTRISDNLTWVNSVIPEPQEYALAAAAGLAGLTFWRRLRAAHRGFFQFRFGRVPVRIGEGWIKANAGADSTSSRFCGTRKG